MTEYIPSDTCKKKCCAIGNVYVKYVCSVGCHCFSTTAFVETAIFALMLDLFMYDLIYQCTKLKKKRKSNNELNSLFNSCI